jgi:hypothetical protein
LFFVIPFAYAFEAPAAAFTGMIVAFCSHWVSRPKWLYAIAGAAGGMSSVPNYYTMSLLNKSAYLRVDWRTVVHTSEVLSLLVAGVIAALCCTRLSRRFWLSNREPDSLAILGVAE